MTTVITFHLLDKDGNPVSVGELAFENGRLVFEGDADKSAMAFINSVIRQYDEQMDYYKTMEERLGGSA